MKSSSHDVALYCSDWGCCETVAHSLAPTRGAPEPEPEPGLRLSHGAVRDCWSSEIKVESFSAFLKTKE